MACKMGTINRRAGILEEGIKLGIVAYFGWDNIRIWRMNMAFVNEWGNNGI